MHLQVTVAHRAASRGFPQQEVIAAGEMQVVTLGVCIPPRAQLTCTPTPGSVARVSRPRRSWAFWQAQQVVRLFAVVLRLEVLPAEPRRDNHPYRVSATGDVELPFAALDPRNGVLFGELPALPVGVDSPDASD